MCCVVLNLVDECTFESRILNDWNCKSQHSFGIDHFIQWIYFFTIIITKVGKATFEIHHVRRIRDETEQNLIRRPLNPVQVTTKPPTLKNCMQYKPTQKHLINVKEMFIIYFQKICFLNVRGYKPITHKTIEYSITRID